MNEPLITEIGLCDMTQEKWNCLTALEKQRLRDNSGLTKQLSGLERCRVEVVTDYGETRRFWVGKSTGWRPIHLEIKNSRSLGGSPAESHYKSVKIVRGSQ